MKNSNEMKIKHNNGTFWNAENDCWTKNECAAETYRSKEDLPDFIDVDKDTMLELGGDIYYTDNDDGVARVTNFFKN